MSESIRIAAYELDGDSIGTVTISWDEDEGRSRMYVNSFPVRRIYPQSGWMVLDVTWTDSNGRARQNMKVDENEYKRLTDPRDDEAE